MKRRSLLLVSGASVLLAAVGRWLLRENAAPQGASPGSDLHAWLDTLMPAEADFPGALALGVGDRVDAALARNAVYGELTRQALAWLAVRAGEAGSQSFAALPEAARAAIVGEAAAAPLGSLPRTFFQATLDDVLYYAYAEPRAWVGLGYSGPPQPIGFPDHALPPAKP